MIQQLIKKYKDWKADREARIQSARKMAHYMQTMTWMEQRSLRDRNANNLRTFPKRQQPQSTEFQQLVSNYLAK